MINVVSIQGLRSSECFGATEGDSANSERLVHSTAYFLSRRSQALNAKTWYRDSEFDSFNVFNVDNAETRSKPVKVFSFTLSDVPQGLISTPPRWYIPVLEYTIGMRIKGCRSVRKPTQPTPLIVAGQPAATERSAISAVVRGFDQEVFLTTRRGPQSGVSPKRGENIECGLAGSRFARRHFCSRGNESRQGPRSQCCVIAHHSAHKSC